MPRVAFGVTFVSPHKKSDNDRLPNRSTIVSDPTHKTLADRIWNTRSFSPGLLVLTGKLRTEEK